MPKGKPIEKVKDPVRVDEIYNKFCAACKEANARCIFSNRVHLNESCIKCAIAWMLNHYEVIEIDKDKEVTFREYIDDVEELASYYMDDISVSLEKLEKEHPEIMTKYTDQLVKDTLVESVNNKIHAF